MSIKIQMFSNAQMAMNREILQHPLLREQLLEDTSRDEGMRIGIIAAFVGIVMDGAYSQSDLERLYGIITWKLREKRKIRVISDIPRIVGISGETLN